MSDVNNLLLELFVEELPPKALKKLGQSFAQLVADSLKAQGLAEAGGEHAAHVDTLHILALDAGALDRLHLAQGLLARTDAQRFAPLRGEPRQLRERGGKCDGVGNRLNFDQCLSSPCPRDSDSELSG